MATPRKLSVKELATELKRSPCFVYRMRSAGFAMEWDFESRCFVANPEDARGWIVRHRFTVVKGRAVVSGVPKGTKRNR